MVVKIKLPTNIEPFVTGGHHLTPSATILLQQYYRAIVDLQGRTLVLEPFHLLISSVSPVNGALGHVQNAAVVVTFDNTVSVGTGNIVIREQNTAGVYSDKTTINVVTDQGTSPGQVTFAGSTVTIYPETQAVMMRYSIQIDATAVVGFVGVDDDTTLVHVTDTGKVLPSTADSAYTNIFDNQTFSTIRSLDGSGDDNTIYKNCTFQNTSGNAMDIRNVDNVTIFNCNFINIGGVGVRLRSTGSTSNVTIFDCTFTDIDKSGIQTAKRHATSIDHTNLLVHNNTLTRTGITQTGGSTHGIYIQATDAVVSQNSVLVSVDGNGISVRTAAIIYGNIIDIVSDNDNFGSACKYFSDHLAGPIASPRTNDQLTIAFNTIDGNNDLFSGIEAKKAGSPEGSFTDAEWHINLVDVYANTITGITDNDTLFTTLLGLGYVTVTLNGVAQ